MVFASFGPALVEMFKKNPPYLMEYDDSKSSHVVSHSDKSLTFGSI